MTFLAENSNIFNFYFNNGNNDKVASSQFGYWGFVIVIAAILISLLLANLLIKVIKPLSRALVPSPVLAGFILLAVLAIFKGCGIELFNTEVLEMLTYHCLGLGFVATSLKKKDKSEEAVKKANAKAIFDSSLVTVGGYLIQAIIGLAVSITFYFIIKSWPASGVLVPMGYGQGPGQALIWGSTYEAYNTAASEVTSEFGSLPSGTSFGLAVAALGFVSASVGGILYLAINRKKGHPKFQGHTEETAQMETVETFTSPQDIPASGTIDKLSVNIGLVVLGYTISFLLILGISALCEKYGYKADGKPNILINTVKPLFWGFNFIIGTGIGALLKAIIVKFENKGAIKHNYINNYFMDRISGFLFDVMVVAAIASINVFDFAHPEFLLPLLTMCVIACIGTFIYCKKVCDHLFKAQGYSEESFLAMFGMLTGTASTGVILLREIDPEFKTPACSNMVFQSLWSVVLGAPVLLLMGTVGRSWSGLITCSIVFVVYFAFIMLMIYRDKIFKKKQAK